MVTASAGLLVGMAGPAQADAVHYVYNTGGDGLWLHPDSTAVRSTVSILMEEGSEFDVRCWSYGDDVNGDAVWLYGTHAATGATGFVADYYIDTYWSTTADLDAQGIRNCDSYGSNTESADPVGGDDWAPYCGSSEYVDAITVARWPDGNFQIKLDPSWKARIALDPYAATVAQWHAIQGCVPGLYGSLADSIWDQLTCHQYLALVPGSNDSIWASGPTYDLESWRGTFPDNWEGWWSTRCGNLLGTDPIVDPQ